VICELGIIMADIFFGGKKSSKSDAKKTLMVHTADNWLGTFGVDFYADGGGNLMRVILEVENPSDNLEKYVREKFPPKWEGWRLVVLKVPIGHIEVFHTDLDRQW
tara:strand:- start:293 stop:607 length:315 start_codon:yes stop_codon:yes gene_type:complete